MPTDNTTAYINSVDYKELEPKILELNSVLEDLNSKSIASRKLRYQDIDIEAEREQGSLQPDEMLIPQHIIDTNIRREQSSYVQYVTQSPRAVICEDQDGLTTDLSILDKDLTKKIRYDGWQLSMFGNIDSFQANGYGFMELVYDKNAPGGVSHESVEYGDFAFLSDTRDIQAVEMTMRAYYFTRTRLSDLKAKDLNNVQEYEFEPEQVQKLLESNPDNTNTESAQETDGDKSSLYRIKKVMFRINGIVHVAWCVPNICDDWLRKPRPLFIGDRQKKASIKNKIQQIGANLLGNQNAPQVYESEEAYETQYPYFLFPYLITENDTISQLKGRVFLDQDIQEAVTSLISSACTQARRAAGLYFSKDTSDPNDDVLMQKNVFFRSGCLINGKVQAFELPAPDPSMFSAIQMLVSGNQNETSQVNFAVNNRKDSRKTAKEIQVASQQATLLSTVQVVLFSLALKKMYTRMSEIIVNRVRGGVIKVSNDILPLYFKNFVVKPSGDIDVIEKQQNIQMMMQAWPVVSQTPMAQVFLVDLMEALFPLQAPKYIAALQQAQAQQQSQQAQMIQQAMMMLQQLSKGIVDLSKHPEFFSDTGRVHALPVVEMTADKIQQIEAQMQQKPNQPQQHK